MVGECADGAEVPDVAPRVRPDVVLMDVQMPRVSGPDATRTLLTGQPDGPGADGQRLDHLTHAGRCGRGRRLGIPAQGRRSARARRPPSGPSPPAAPPGQAIQRRPTQAHQPDKLPAGRTRPRTSESRVLPALTNPRSCTVDVVVTLPVFECYPLSCAFVCASPRGPATRTRPGSQPKGNPRVATILWGVAAILMVAGFLPITHRITPRNTLAALSGGRRWVRSGCRNRHRTDGAPACQAAAPGRSRSGGRPAGSSEGTAAGTEQFPIPQNWA